MSETLPSRSGMLAAAIGVVALIPSVVLVGFGIFGMLVPRMLTHPIVVLGGVVLALVINVGASIRWRMQANADGVAMECDVRLRYRGINRTVIIAGGAIAAVVLMYVMSVNFGAS